jgi:hypothetical protein
MKKKLWVAPPSSNGGREARKTWPYIVRQFSSSEDNEDDICTYENYESKENTWGRGFVAS